MEAKEGATGSQTEKDKLGTYVLRDLINDIPLPSDEDGQQAHITCVDAWNGNVYIGTSAGEVLHYVSIPPDPADPAGEASYIFATKLEPPYTTRQEGPDAGVKQILVLPDAGKACILCNATASFYTLPELSPAFGDKVQQKECTWVGGLDANQSTEEHVNNNSTVIVICVKLRTRLIRVGKDARRIGDIQLGGVIAIQRRGDLACVADKNTYSLLDVVNHRKNDLFPISSISEPEPEKPLPELPRASSHSPSRSLSAASPSRKPHVHERNVSLGANLRDGSGTQSPWPARGSSRQTLSPAQPSSREPSPPKAQEPAAQPLEPERKTSTTATATPLPPNIVTPSPNEFLLTTGTQLSEPGVGMFVNLDGDVSRPPLTFSSYPHSLVLDGESANSEPGTPGPPDAEGYVLAVVQKQLAEGTLAGIEIQRWDGDPGDPNHSKQFLKAQLGSAPPTEDDICNLSGLRLATSTTELAVPEISTNLRLRRLDLGKESTEEDAKRNVEEDKFAARFANIQGRVLFFTKDKVSWVIQNPLIVKLEAQLGLAVRQNTANELSIDVADVQRIINSIRGQEARNELEFVTLTYIRQKASLLLFGKLVIQTANGFISYERDKRLAEEALVDGDVDPRTVLSLVPPFIEEVDEGKQGIWLSQGLQETLTMLRNGFDKDKLTQDPDGAYGDNLLHILKRYLQTWRKKKGFGSVADEAQVFRSVDVALLHVLLLLDQNSPRGPATAGSVRAELNEVVDHGVDCFEHAEQLFEHFHRLFMLSRLYQSRKIPAKVLSTWKRILEGEKDAGGELIEGEQGLRRYLTKIRDHALVQEYGVWLANRNPKLGVQVFADDSSRVKFEPSEAVAILKEKAPGAVKDYLEHLVFGKNHVQYVNDLIAFYLDTVLTELDGSDASKKLLLQWNETYRALRPPKPTYRQFIEDNATDAEWMRNRLRLLQLIGGSHGAASKYDVHSLRERLAPYSDELVPEMIILNGREGKHEEALRLLTHGLGDYDTAIRYCLLGGSSIFHPSSDFSPEQSLPSKEEQAALFEYLLHEFFKIEDLSERLERTAELLERFGGWFEISKVLDLIPDGWSVELVSAFLIHALRRLVRERNETIVVKALASAQNLKKAVEFIEKTESIGPTVVNGVAAVNAG